ncbi:AgmX/PglI C-terminal domain-containing protein [Anaeromyxobacter oryzae]|uniref:TonB C-terminal domain-containing protein n=1 Tax=Anaeromyxobacter oryzae TaxID=2918170 RepID=A0ABM7WUX9_9BACT|nr:AgmX/PglI C-terminal domain-containing protein [Anaeromyxobacter oryzae]BDG03314.1 hypothetical protein AMOR_23100 [Anaeromyxobacter oryzae]
MRLALLPALAALALVLVLTACGRDREPATATTAAPQAPAPAADAGPALDPGRLAPHAPSRSTRGPARDAASAAPLCGDPGTGPEPDGALLRAFVAGRTKGIRECYDRALKRDASLRGRVVVRFTIGRCGEVSELELTGKRRGPSDLADCVTRAVKAWRLPFRPSEPVAVEYPFNFTAG